MSDLRLLQQIQSYDKDWCYQYQKRLDTLQEDMRTYHWTEEDIKNISLDDFKFRYVDSELEKARLSILAPETNISLLKKEREISLLGLRDEDLIQNGIIPSKDENERKKQIIELNIRYE